MSVEKAMDILCVTHISTHMAIEVIVLDSVDFIKEYIAP
jgi:hypothetical protein